MKSWGKRGMRHLVVGGVVIAIATVGLILTAVHAEDPPAGVPGTVAPPDAGSPAGAPPTPTVKILFKILPPGNATVSWGKKRLGFIKPRAPLIIERARDSGPLDVTVRASGFLPVHTRAYTFTNSVVAVKLTPLDLKNTIYGYREVLPPDVDGGMPPVTIAAPDAGASAGP
jgi:hypothetical protein